MTIQALRASAKVIVCLFRAFVSCVCLEPLTGVEPATLGMEVRCSTD